MTSFIAAAVALTLLAMAVVVLGPRRQRRSAEVSRAQVNTTVLRQQLAELQSDRERGLLDEREYARARDELRQRLLLDLEAAPRASTATRISPRAALLLLAGAMPLAAAALYVQFGHPRLLGAPTTASAAAGQGEAAAGDLLIRLEAQVAAAPDDGRAWVLLARARMQRDAFGPAAFAYARALEVSSKVARDPLIWCEYADALGMAQGGRLAGGPRERIDKALALDPAHPRALEMAGSAAYEAGDFGDAARYWNQLLTQLPASSEEHAQLAAAIARAEQRAQFRLPQS